MADNALRLGPYSVHRNRHLSSWLIFSVHAAQWDMRSSLESLNGAAPACVLFSRHTNPIYIVKSLSFFSSVVADIALRLGPLASKKQRLTFVQRLSGSTNVAGSAGKGLAIHDRSRLSQCI